MRRRRRYVCFLEEGFGRHRSVGPLVPLVDGFDGELLYYPEIIPVALDFRRVLVDTVAKPQRLFDLSPRQFEELVADIWKRFGYVTELTRRTRDGGRDVIAIKEAEANLRILIECKRWSNANRVDVGIVRSLYGVKIHERSSKAILATTSRFTKAATDFFSEHLWELEPRDFDGVVEWLKLALATHSL